MTSTDRPTLRIVLVDDQELVRTGLRALAERDGDVEVVGEAADGASGVRRVQELRPDVVLMDIRMPQLDGIAATARIVADPALRDVRVIVLTTFDDDQDILGAIGAGAAGYLLKDVGPEDLRAAIRVVAAGESLLSPSVTGTVLERLGEHLGTRVRPELLEGLTPREREVLALVGRGLTNDEIGAELFLSPATARTYVSRLLATLHARDRSRLVVIAYESGLVRPGG
ncbi:response regulator transcription factor [Brachybacterium sp. YJGR34]|uniref:response regulator transcription factor n=1 Tax=Brachybacterium sp. YJGR34 TaxID=2059911 RepID=UPI000E0B4E18|nr:response regulator transcription factor [Brachybacterium sp. YJGR34]